MVLRFDFDAIELARRSIVHHQINMSTSDRGEEEEAYGEDEICADTESIVN